MASTIEVHLYDRRIFRRRLHSAPVGIESRTKRDRVGVTRDVSAGGLLLGTRSRFALGEELVIRIRAPGCRRDRFARGVVVRTTTDRLDATFPHLMAVSFPEPVPELVS